jgi:TRAP-type C4-dicarboxylate transport system substrate-binding protein
MGPVQNYADYARTGVADIAWFLHGATPGRFPLTEIIQLPYMVGSAEIGIKTLNDPQVLNLLEPEYQGLKVLYLLTHQPGNLHTASKPVRSVADMNGLRIRSFRLGDDQELYCRTGRHAGRSAAERHGRRAAEGYH